LVDELKRSGVAARLDFVELSMEIKRMSHFQTVVDRHCSQDGNDDQQPVIAVGEGSMMEEGDFARRDTPRQRNNLSTMLARGSSKRVEGHSFDRIFPRELLENMMAVATACPPEPALASMTTV